MKSLINMINHRACEVMEESKAQASVFMAKFSILSGGWSIPISFKKEDESYLFVFSDGSYVGANQIFFSDEYLSVAEELSYSKETIALDEGVKHKDSALLKPKMAITKGYKNEIERNLQSFWSEEENIEIAGTTEAAFELFFMP